MWFLRILGAMLISSLYVALVGMLSILANAKMAGAVVNLANNLVAVRDPGTPWLQYLAVGVATVSALMLFRVVAIGELNKVHGRQTAWTTTATMVMLVSIPMLNTTAPYQGGIASPLPAGLAWLQAGAFSPAVHVCLMSFVVMAWSAERRDRTNRPSVEEAGRLHDEG